MRVNPSTDLALTVKGRGVEQVKSVIHLGSTLTADGGTLEDIPSRNKKVHGAFVLL
jgi:hypothetical protein